MLKKYQNDFLRFISFQLKRIFEWKLSFLCITFAQKCSKRNVFMKKENFKNFEGLQVKHKESIAKSYLFCGL